MSYDKNQFADFIKRSLTKRGLWSQAAVNLLLGTAAQESRFGTYLVQLGNGPARGAFQMERSTFLWLVDTYKNKYPEIVGRVFEDLEFDLDFAILMCRLRYLVVPQPLPDANDLPAIAAYWKQHYNTPLGKGTTDEFIRNYHRYVT